MGEQNVYSVFHKKRETLEGHEKVIPIILINEISNLSWYPKIIGYNFDAVQILKTAFPLLHPPPKKTKKQPNKNQTTLLQCTDKAEVM